MDAETPMTSQTTTTPQPTQSVQSTSPNSHGTSFLRVLALLAFALVIAILASVGTYYFLSQNQVQETSQPAYKAVPTAVPTQSSQSTPSATQDETANWKLFTTKEEPRISFKYPSENGWSAFDNKVAEDFPDYPKGYRSYAGANYNLCGVNCGAVLRIDIYVKNSERDPGNNWVETQMTGNNYYKLSSKQTVTRNGASGTRWEYLPEDNTTARLIFYYFQKDNYSYAVSINDNGALTHKIDLVESGEKIFSTVQFL